MPTDFKQRAVSYFSDASRTVEQIPVDVLDAIFEILCQAYREDRQIFVMGNGGSAALAMSARGPDQDLVFAPQQEQRVQEGVDTRCRRKK